VAAVRGMREVAAARQCEAVVEARRDRDGRFSGEGMSTALERHGNLVKEAVFSAKEGIAWCVKTGNGKPEGCEGRTA